MPQVKILAGDWVEQLRTLEDGSVHCCVTSPPYWGLRDYGVAGQLGLEKTPEEYVAKLVEGFREVRRVLRDDGSIWVNLGDSYTSGGRGEQSRIRSWRPEMPFALKPKDLVGIPWRVAFALQADGWYLRSDIIWHKPNPMPESVTDRPTKSHEYIFLLSKRQSYYYDAEAIKEPSLNGGKVVSLGDKSFSAGQANGRNVEPSGNGLSDTYTVLNDRNKRTVWTVATSPYKEAHFATFPPDLIEPCILAGCLVGGTVLDPFFGSGTTGRVALELGRNCIGIELNPDYVKLAEQRTNVTPGLPMG